MFKNFSFDRSHKNLVKDANSLCHICATITSSSTKNYGNPVEADAATEIVLVLIKAKFTQKGLFILKKAFT
jgi:hypothetical protein